MIRTFLGLASLLCLLVVTPANARGEIGAKFGSHDPRTCPTRTAPLTPATAKQYFICDNEFTMGPNASGESINLVSDVTVQLGNPRPFNANTDTFGFAADNSIDPSQKVVPIRGSFNNWDCGKLGQIGTSPGKSCNLTPDMHAQGICFKSSFGEWHCTMSDMGATREFVAAHAPPTQP